MSSRTFCAAIALLATVIILASCKVDESSEVAAYRSILDQGLTATDVITDQPRMNVIDVLRLANAQNESLAIEGENYVQALINRRRAVANFLPTISLSPSYIWHDDTGSGRSSALNTSIDTDIGFNPVRDVATLRQTDSAIEERRALLRDFQDVLLIDVARVHYEVIRAEREVAVLESSLGVQNERVNDARARVDAGLLRPLDVSLTEAQAAHTATTLVAARLRVQTARSQLALLTSTAVHDRELVDEVEVPSSQPSFEELLALAEMNRQDLMAAHRRIDAAGHQVESAYGQYFPSVSLNLQWFLQRQSQPTNLDWTSLFQVSVPLFSAGLIEADVRTALSILRQTKLLYSLTRREVERDVEVALANLRASFESVERLHVQVKAAGDALQQSEALYQVGLATNLERLSSQDALLAAELDLVNAELDTKTFYLDLLRTTGTLHQLLGLERTDELNANHTAFRKRMFVGANSGADH